MSLLSLINWRREISNIYNEVRSEEDGIIAWNKWKDKREKLFKFHPESPTFNPKKQSGFNDVPVLHSYNEKFSLFSKFELISNPETIELNTDENSTTLLKPFIKTLNLKNFLGIELTVFRIKGYGGGLFLPFTDSGCKSGGDHYEGGRYLIDTIKGADLGELKNDELRLDFNFSYNPSCSYNSKWTCPILNDYNRIPILVDAGEKKPKNFLI